MSNGKKKGLENDQSYHEKETDQTVESDASLISQITHRWANSRRVEWMIGLVLLLRRFHLRLCSLSRSSAGLVLSVQLQHQVNRAPVAQLPLHHEF